MNVRSPLTVPERAKFSADDFWLLARSGALDRYPKSELIEGEIWVMSAVHSWHARTMARLAFELRSALLRAGMSLEVYSPVSVALSDESVPEPDLALGQDHDDGPLPLAAVRLAVEVSDSTLEIDLGRKAALYARHGIPEYWVVAREGSRLYRHALPSPEGYTRRDEFALGEPVSSLTLPELIVDTAGLL
jgi:Uma2 family endonuclease